MRSRLFYWILGLGGVGGGLLLAATLAWRNGSQAPEPEAVAQRPTPPVGADIRQCAECHPSLTGQFELSPHFDTLHRADEPEVAARFAGHGVISPSGGPQLSYRLKDGELILYADEDPFTYPATFVFGSGRHGQTPVSTRVNNRNETELLEHDLTWYPGYGLDLTVGHRDDEFEGLKRFGHPHDAEVTRDCFGCHTSHLPSEGNVLLLDDLIPGIRCNRCHEGLDEHLAAAAEGAAHRSVWADLSPQESIRRCGECHRTIENIHPDRRRPDETSLTRFAPVGLELSPCFQGQGNLRMDCTTCHDPHAPPPDDLSVYRQACLKCHDGAEHASCSAEPATSDCLACHMPKVDFASTVQFTDHWIRIRDEPPPEEAEAVSSGE